MRGEWRNLQTAAGENLLDLLHREAEQSLTPTEQQKLEAARSDPQVQAARQALNHAVALLKLPMPPMLRSVAPDVVAELTLARQLASPAMPRSTAPQVTEAIQLSVKLRPPLLPHSVTDEVVAEIQAARMLQTPPMPRSVVAAVLDDLRSARALGEVPAPPPAASLADSVVSRIRRDFSPTSPAPPEVLLPAASPSSPTPTIGPALHVLAGPHPLQPVAVNPASRNPAPFVLVGGLLVGLTLLALTTAWPNLAAGAVVLRTLLNQVSPLAGLGLALLLLTSVLITWRPTPALRTAGAGAFALSAILTIPALYNVAGGANGLSIGHDVTVSGPVNGNVIAIGGNVRLKPGADVRGEVVTLLGDVHRDEGAQVQGRVNALLGHAPGDREAIQTRPINNLSLATAAAFRPVLGWLGAAAWPQIFVALTGGLLLLLFLAGAAPLLARRQRHAPMRTLALGVLMLSALTLPAMALGLTGLLGPALLVTATAALVIATGLSVSVYDVGRAVAYRFKLPVPDAVGALLGLSAFAASLSYAPLAFALALVGGAWGAGTLFLTRQHLRSAE
ncbi:polymer-forming cytoskeletal protein [Deinococcus fonticola]|uniref:polymer-forming cytoskeletal protein n=1 Tax=Deinococcus fonticola TaxID=2528713 RepID=UPI001431A9D6|nr:polymer-forming cytoskeletal protein [Deinococcus fonticola]